MGTVPSERMRRILSTFNLKCRVLTVAVTQVVLDTGLLVLHVFGACKVVNEESSIGGILLYPTPNLTNYQVISLTTFHVVSNVLATVMIILNIVLFYGIFLRKTNLVFSWFLGNCMILLPYLIMLFYSFIILIVVYIIEYILLMVLTVIYIKTIYPYYDWLLYTSRTYEARKNQS